MEPASVVPLAQGPVLLEKVLLVDDNEDNRVIYRAVLEHAGYIVGEAADGEEALGVVSELEPDLIVMDVTMPVMDGLEATRRLKADASTHSIPVLVLTAHAHSAAKDEAFAAGADSYLSKPCLPRDMLAEVARLLAVHG